MNRYPQYDFSPDVSRRLRGFRKYLESQGAGKDTIRQKSNYAGYYLNWLYKEGMHQEDARYNDMLSFIDYCRLEEKSKRQINSMLRSVRNYYQYLKETGSNIINPALNLHVRGEIQKLPSGIIAWQELERIYQGYNTETLREQRNKVILGLYVYQAVTTGELQRMEPGHLKLKEGKVYITGTRRSNGRVLDLQPFQIMQLHEYLSDIRPQILKGINKPGTASPASRPGRKPDRINLERVREQLFISINGSENIKNSLLHMFRDIRKVNPELQHAKQIRSSVIIHWLKNYNLRQVQYMAGHKYVSSTERYQLNNLDNLQSKLEEYHPLG
jgi:integrase/recombinase XerD